MVQDATLKGKTVAVTRPCGQAEEEAAIIRRKGGKPYFIPTIEIKPLKDLSAVKAFIVELAQGKVDYVVLMSVNGVKHLFTAAENLKQTARLMAGFGKTVVVAVGPRTAEELRTRNIHVSLVPTKYTSEGIAENMQQRFSLRGKKVIIPRTTAANPTLKEKLTEVGATVEEVHVYASGLPENVELKEDFLRNLSAGKIHAIVFGSALCAKNLFQMLSSQISTEKLHSLFNEKATVVAIGPVTANALKELGVKAKVMPDAHTFEEALTALADYWNAK